MRAVVGTAEPFAVRVDGWRAWSTSAFHLNRFPGGHFYWRDDPGGLRAVLTEFFGAD
jgi:surfactin synthase thioesterase subunit